MGFKPRFRRVAVHWDDAVQAEGWRHPDEPFDVLPRVVSVGYIIQRDRHSIELAQSATAHGLVADVLRIPIGCVVRIERV